MSVPGLELYARINIIITLFPEILDSDWSITTFCFKLLQLILFIYLCSYMCFQIDVAPKQVMFFFSYIVSQVCR